MAEATTQTPGEGSEESSGPQPASTAAQVAAEATPVEGDQAPTKGDETEVAAADAEGNESADAEGNESADAEGDETDVAAADAEGDESADAEGDETDVAAADAEGDESADAEGDESADAEQDPEQEGETQQEEPRPEGPKPGPTPSDPAAVALVTALMRLREALASSRLPLDVIGADDARHQRKVMLDQLEDYVLPRLVQLEAPVLAVVGGSTGAGKSTLVNSLVGDVVSEPGVLRPTTRSPVLVHHPADTDWFNGGRILPGLPRSTGTTPGGNDPGSLRLVAADTIPQGLAILDAPDIDSVVEANRELAAQLLAAADLWLFVTTSARYADAVPWDFLKDAAERSTAVAVVLDRVAPASAEDVLGHLAHMLLERGLGESPLFAVPESTVDDDGLLPPDAAGQIKTWLTELAADSGARAAVVRRTLQGAVKAMVKKVPPFAAAVRAQSDTIVELRSSAETAYARAVKDVEKATADGTLLRGEVLARWQQFVGTGELLKGLQSGVGRLRDKIRNAVRGKPQQPTRDVADAVESGLEALLREHSEAAAERAEESWQSTVAGRQLLEAGERDLGRSSRTFSADAARAVRDWQGYVLDLVRHEGADRRSTARLLSYGVNGLGIALMVVVFASTAFVPTGAEVGVGAGTALVGQKLLEAVFGDQAVRTLAAQAKEDLNGRVRGLMDAELERYYAVLNAHAADPDAARRLTEAVRAVEDCT